MTRRMNPEDRRVQILQAAVAVATRTGYHTLTRDTVAAEARMSVGLMYRHFTSMDDLKRSVMEEAIRQRNLPILAQGLAIQDRTAQGAPEELRVLAAVKLSTRGGA